jgi:hypothetical protein
LSFTLVPNLYESRISKKLHRFLRSSIIAAHAGPKECSMISAIHRQWVRATAFACALTLAPGEGLLRAQQPPAEPKPAAGAAAKKTADQLDSLVAPIALYPDPLLAQVLAATTYPLEIVQAARWLKDNSKLTGENLTKAAAKQPWDPSVSAMVAFPDALKLLDANIQWTQDLGNAFLDQQSDVMDAVQRMRKKAKDGGKLQSSKEQKVEVQTVEQKQVIVIQPSDPQVIYVPSYSPTVVYGAPPVYAYPPVVYPSTGAVVATAAVSFGVGVMMGAMWSGCCGGSYGWGMGWGGNNITINNNFSNRYNYNNISGGNRINTGNIGSGNGNWQHNAEHRRSVPYGNKDTAQRFNSNRDQSGRTDRGNRTNDRGQGDRGQGDRGQGDRGQGDRGQGDRGQGDRGGGRDNAGRDAVGDRDRGQSGSRSGAGQDRVGNRSVDSGSRSNSAFGDGGSRAKTEAASNRGFSSTRSSGSSSRSSGGFSGGGSRSSGGASRGGGRRR